MAKMVGLSKKLRLSWLNHTVNLTKEHLAEKQIKEDLNEYLKFEIESQINIRKTREILMRIWFYDNDYTKQLRPAALKLMDKYPEYSMAIHWCMMLAAYPVFVDICRLIGKMSEFQNDITLGRIKQKLFDEWGERPTLYHSIDKLIATLKEFDVLESEKVGKYFIKRHKIGNAEIGNFMAYTAILVGDKEYYKEHEINSLALLFPFEYKVKKEELLQDSRFNKSHIGHELVVAPAR